MSKTARKKRDRAESTKRLLQAGLEAFSRLGFDGASTAVIARKAGLSESLIIRYFGGKEGLLFAILKAYADERCQAGSEYPVGANLAEELTNFTLSETLRDCSQLDFFRVVMSRAITDAKFRQKMVEKLPCDRVHPLFEKRVRAFLPESVSSESIAELQAMLQTYGFGLVHFGRLILEMPEDEIRERIAGFCTVLAAGFVPALAGAAPGLKTRSASAKAQRKVAV